MSLSLFLVPTPSYISCRSLDFINLMAYDFHSSWEKTTGHNSPLYKRQGESGAAAERNVVSSQWGEAGGGPLSSRTCAVASFEPQFPKTKAGKPSKTPRTRLFLLSLLACFVLSHATSEGKVSLLCKILADNREVILMTLDTQGTNGEASWERDSTANMAPTCFTSIPCPRLTTLQGTSLEEKQLRPWKGRLALNCSWDFLPNSFSLGCLASLYTPSL